MRALRPGQGERVPTAALRSCVQDFMRGMAAFLREPNASLLSGSLLSLERLVALARLQDARRLSLFCTELYELMSWAGAALPLRAPVQALLAQASVCLMHSVQTCAVTVADGLLDARTLHEMRAARGALDVTIAAAVTAESRLLPAAFVQALRARTEEALRECGAVSEHDAAPWREPPVPGAALFWPGLIGTDQPVPKMLGLLWVHWHCAGVLRGIVPQHRMAESALSSQTLRGTFLQLASHALLRTLTERCREIAQASNGNSVVFVDAAVRELSSAQFSLCFVTGIGGQGILDSMFRIAETLALHLQCWRDLPGHDDAMLAFCLLCLCGALEERAKASPQHEVLQAHRRAMHSRVSGYTAQRQRMLRREIAVEMPQQASLRPAFAEQVALHVAVLQQFIERHEPQSVSVMSDDVFLSLAQLTRACLCVGEMALYEMLERMRMLFYLSIESQISIPAALLVNLSQLLQLLRISSQRPCPPAVLRSVQDAFYAARRRLLCGAKQQLQAVELSPSGEATSAPLRVHAAKLPVYLATNIHALMVAPEQLRLCGSDPVRFHRLARLCLLELGMLARGARALHVYRVAELSEALAQVHRSLAVLQQVPQQAACDLLTQAHLSLRQSLNRAAARQAVPDARDIIAQLYRWLETHSRVVLATDSAEHRQRSLALARALRSGLQSLQDAMRLLPASAGQGLALAQDILAEQRHYLQQLEEELEDSGLVSLARWREPLLLVAAQVANQTGRHVRLLVENDGVRIERQLAGNLLCLLEHLLTGVIVHSIESPLQRRGAGKPATAWVRLRTEQAHAALLLLLEDDGQGLPSAELIDLQARLQVFGASVRDVQGKPPTRRLQVSVPLQSTRWDIVPKPL